MRHLLPALLFTAACGGSESKPMSTTTFGGGRPVELRTPSDLTAGKQYPLVVVLHGFTATGLLQAAYFQAADLTDADAALWIAPDGTTNNAGQQFWNADSACCDFNHQNPDDVGYLGSLVDDIIEEWPIDENQIFFVGHSNGGYMSYRMACERADRIAAVISLAGNASSAPSACTPSQPVSVLHMHGTADGTVPYSGGSGVGGVGAVSSVEQWAGHNDCQTTRTATVTLDLDTAIGGAETHGETLGGCPSGVGIDLWTLEGSGHIPSFNNSIAMTLFDWFAAHKR
jgi:polyhydroxybutyrate depolymerase